MTEDGLVGMGGVNNNPFCHEGQVGRLRRFYVSKKYRRKGYGAKLLNHIVQECCQNYDVIHLYTDNPKACLFYEMNGFKKVENIEKVSHTLDRSN